MSFPPTTSENKNQHNAHVCQSSTISTSPEDGTQSKNLLGHEKPSLEHGKPSWIDGKQQLECKRCGNIVGTLPSLLQYLSNSTDQSLSQNTNSSIPSTNTEDPSLKYTNMCSTFLSHLSNKVEHAQCESRVSNYSDPLLWKYRISLRSNDSMNIFSGYNLESLMGRELRRIVKDFNKFKLIILPSTSQTKTQCLIFHILSTNTPTWFSNQTMQQVNLISFENLPSISNNKYCDGQNVFALPDYPSPSIHVSHKQFRIGLKCFDLSFFFWNNVLIIQ